MGEIPDLPEFRIAKPPHSGALRRMASTPLTSSFLNNSSMSTGAPVNLTGSSARHMGAKNALSGSGHGLFDPYRSPSSSPQHCYHHDKDQITEKSELSSRIDSSPLQPTSVQRSVLSSPPPSGADSFPSDDVPAESTSGSLANQVRTARKMPSTPSLGQHMREGQTISHLEHQQKRHVDRFTMGLARGHLHATVSKWTGSSPRSEGEMSEDEELDERNVDIDRANEEIDNYALSPWATGPSALAAAKAAQKAGIIISDDTSGDTSDKKFSDEDMDKVQSTAVQNEPVPPQGLASTGAFASSSTMIEDDAETAVSVIGTISDPTPMQPAESDDVVNGGVDSGSVYTATKELNSLMIGCAAEQKDNGKKQKKEGDAVAKSHSDEDTEMAEATWDMQD
ncbi:hypothetical protein BCR41DRAFT_145870 [Lobosporangium transversale]|uniref:Uncharacterized protein n=1 Tax=Lobosporangium transversale TaxID=64571 RepID=A0A1Y2GEG7_9FUNG|nr:hypothetical protein BCR41DRAFT_145870 [Lobosporangium transversale]ORZ08546.1 hypothetical protein BCR41DRAFT_145870 [Lobosporangium transversale]|eukprot:XP_021878474.1 hypothetical protein BCR41DRAFT_145870 [Lobosporangium transversale]